MIKTREGTSYSKLWYKLEGNTLYRRDIDGVFIPFKYEVEVVK